MYTTSGSRCNRLQGFDWIDIAAYEVDFLISLKPVLICCPNCLLMILSSVSQQNKLSIIPTLGTNELVIADLYKLTYLSFSESPPPKDPALFPTWPSKGSGEK